MSAAWLIAALGAASLGWLAADLLRERRRRRHRSREAEARLLRHQERVVAANGHPRTGNVEHLGPLR